MQLAVPLLSRRDDANDFNGNRSQNTAQINTFQAKKAPAEAPANNRWKLFSEKRLAILSRVW